MSLDSIIARGKYVKAQRANVLRQLAQGQEGTQQHEETLGSSTTVVDVRLGVCSGTLWLLPGGVCARPTIRG